MKLKASFTIEATYVIGIIMIAIASLIIYVYKFHGRVIAEYITHYSVSKAAHLEKIYEEENIEKINSEANNYVENIKIIGNSRLNVENNFFSTNGSINIYSENYNLKTSIYNPEGLMRMTTILEGLQDKIKEKEEKKDAGKKEYKFKKVP